MSEHGGGPVVELAGRRRHGAATGAEPRPAVATPPLASRRVRLRPIREQDRRFLYELMSTPEAGGRVRFGGSTPSPEKVLATLWESVLAQFVVESAEGGRPLGLVAITSPDFRNGFAYVSAVGTVESQGSGSIAEAALLAFHYAFSTWPFRKVYMEATDDSFQAFAGGLGELFREEARLIDHVFWNGRWVDLVIVAVYRDTWSARVPRMLRLLTRRRGERGAALSLDLEEEEPR